METLVNQKTEFNGKIFNAVRAIVRLDDGQEATRDIVEHSGGAGVVAYTGTSVILIKQFRIGVGKEVIEIPAGLLEGHEDPEKRGAAELLEETGYTAGRMTSLGAIYPSAGFSTEKVHLFIGEDLKHVGQDLEWDEQIEVVEYSIKEIKINRKT